ncbi:MAG: glycoside hydrolase family 32 protein [SAR324 cluster bacterium]|nr:glycoside hydrolase family 32 protein [SAR324 cluster bacterium]
MISKDKTSKNKHDYTSLAPQYTFSETLEAQLQEIESNPTVLQMADARKGKASDPHRPYYHFIDSENMLNDPNGFCYWQGRWHLFYQAYPPEDSRRAHWGHAISDDLIHWRDLPYAIYPNPEEESYSGGALVEKDRVVVVYHGTKVGNMAAVSHDPLLLNWEKLSGKPIIPFAREDEPPLPYGIYDPCIWKKDETYYCLNGGILPHAPSGKHIRANYLFRSKDLAHWEYLHQFVEGDLFTRVGDDGSCPYFFPIGDRHILLIYSHLSGGQYLLGDYDQKSDKFLATAHGLFNFGPSNPSGLHAPSATPDGKGGIIVIFNMNPGKPSVNKDAFVNKIWGQIMTLPRHLTLDENNELKMEPAGDIESLRYGQQQIAKTVLPANQEVILEKIEGNAMELIIELDPKDAPMVEVNVLRSPNKEEFTRITFFNKRGFKYQKPLPNLNSSVNVISSALAIPIRHESVISIDTSYSSILPEVLSRAPESAPVVIESNERLQLHIFIDRSVIEVFVNKKQCVAVRVYPGRKDSTGVSLRAQGQAAELSSLHCWQMKNIYE